MQPGIQVSALKVLATELHTRHPHSVITFYDKMDVIKIKEWDDFLQHADHPGSRPLPQEWVNARQIAAVHSEFNNPQHTGHPEWLLQDKAFQTIARLGIDDRPPERPAPKPIPERMQVEQIGILRWGNAVEMAFTAEDFGLYTKCSDMPKRINCAARLMDAKKWFHVPSETRAQVLEFRENPLHPSLLTGQLVQCRILDGAFKGMSLWTLEDRLRLR